MLSNQEVPLPSPHLPTQADPLMVVKQKGLLAKFGIEISKSKPEVVEPHPLDPVKKRRGLFSFKKEQKVFGYDRIDAFNVEVAKCVALQKECEEKLLFEPKDWKDNDIRWRKALGDLFTAAEAYASIRVHQLSKAAIELSNNNKK